MWDYYLDLATSGDRADVARRAHLVTAEDPSLRPLAAKLLDRGGPAGPDPRPGRRSPGVHRAVQRHRRRGPGRRPAAAAGQRCGARAWPRWGTRAGGGGCSPRPESRCRSGGRTLRTIERGGARRARGPGRPPRGALGGRQVGQQRLRGGQPGARPAAADDPQAAQRLHGQLDGLPPWFASELAGGAVVEEHIVGDRFASPSVQADIEPGGRVIVRGTHEQDLSGPHGHTYEGCRFPADPGYSVLLAEHARAVGQVLARQGVLGRFSLDCAVTWQPDRGWTVYALEINLRQGGTSPPLALLANLDPGRYQPDPGHWHSAAGGVRCYRSTDNLLDPRWVGLDPARVIDAVRDAGLGWDRDRRTGVVLHLLSCLAVDGRMGLTAIAPTPGRPTPSTTRPWQSLNASRPEPARSGLRRAEP